MKKWNPNLYMKFSSERVQPSIDLVNRINPVEFESIIDIGCGPGNSTQILANRWGEAQITGLDRSPAMIKKAKEDYPDKKWIISDALTYETENKFDLVFSNAVIQWIPNHKKLLEKFYDMLTDKGVMAIQMPLYWDIPLWQIIDSTANDERWRAKTAKTSGIFTIHDYSFYYEKLSTLFDSVAMWKTDYMQIKDNHIAILKMMKSTGLKPYLEKLEDDTEKKAFEEEFMKKIKNAYPMQKNGKVLLPFKRLFFIGYKS